MSEFQEVNHYDEMARIFDVNGFSRDDLFSQDLKTMLVGMEDAELRENIKFACRSQARVLKCLGEWNDWFKQFTKEIRRKQIRTVSNMPDERISGYDFGEYAVDDKGIHYYNSKAYEMVHFCKGTPFIITKHFENIDGEQNKIELAFKLRGNWKTICCDLRTVSDSRKVLDLSDSGLSINSLESPLVVQYVSDFIANNQDKIEVVPSVGRLGWHGAEFIPYDTKYEFDGYGANKERFDAFKCVGSLEKWVNEMNPARDNPVVRMVVDASFASPMLSKMRSQMFLVHLWGTTEAGKTVAMKAAMSVWGDSDKIMQSFNATTVGLERMALFYKHLPIALDELQTIKDKFNNTDKMIYQLCSGVSKVRGNKFGGNDEQLFWNNVIISTGEQPLTDENSGGGAKNRAIELHCKGRLFENFSRTIEAIDNNYGNAGKTFIDKFIKPNIDGLKSLYKGIVQEFSECSFTDKQRNSIAMMCLADIGYNMIFKGMSQEGAVLDSITFYKSNADMFTNKEDIKIGERSYENFISWVLQNSNKFNGDKQIEQYGIKTFEFVMILPTALDKWCFEANYNKRAVLSEWKGSGLIEGTEQSKYRTKCKIGDDYYNCYKVKMPKESFRLDSLLPADDVTEF